jgi:hypothetical protein
MDPLLIIIARQQQERMAAVSRARQRHGAAYRPDGSDFYYKLGVKLAHLLHVVQAWRPSVHINLKPVRATRLRKVLRLM